MTTYSQITRLRVLIYEPVPNGHHMGDLSRLLPAITSLPVEVVLATVPETLQHQGYQRMVKPVLGPTQVTAGYPLEVIVVGNACTDHTPKAAAAGIENLPFPGRYVEDPIANINNARNRAVHESQRDLLALVDDDVWVEPAWAKALVEGFADQRVSLIGGKVELWWKDVDRPDWFTPHLDRLLTCIDHGSEFAELNSLSIAGANFAFRREVYDAVGGFMNGLDRTGSGVALSGGATEFVMQVRSRGLGIYYSPHAAVKHWVAPQRIEPEYLLRVARANAAGSVFIKPRLNMGNYFRGILGHCWLWGTSLALSLVSSTQGEKMGHQLRGTIGKSGLQAYFRRFLGRSPIEPRT